MAAAAATKLGIETANGASSDGERYCVFISPPHEATGRAYGLVECNIETGDWQSETHKAAA